MRLLWQQEITMRLTSLSVGNVSYLYIELAELS
jgi:hypothetical protein